MTRIIVTLPKLGDTADDVVPVSWLVATGDQVARGQGLLLVETAKTEVEIPAPCAGILVEQVAVIDENITIGAPVAIIEEIAG